MNPIDSVILSGLSETDEAWSAKDLDHACLGFTGKETATALTRLIALNHVRAAFTAWEGQGYGLTVLRITDEGRSALAEQDPPPAVTRA